MAIAALAASLALLGAAGCGDDGDSGKPQTAADTTAQYCAVSKQGDKAGEKFFRALENDPNATPADYKAAERKFIKQMADLLDQLIASAPPAIADDVKVLVAAQRGRAGLGPEVPAAKANAAEKRVNAFEAQAC
jgi:hypothetical protein